MKHQFLDWELGRYAWLEWDDLVRRVQFELCVGRECSRWWLRDLPPRPPIASTALTRYVSGCKA